MTAIDYRGMVLVGAVLAGLICLIAAWDLARRGVAGDHEADVTGGGWTLRIRKFGGPAIFALLGAGLIGWAVAQRATRTETPIDELIYDANGDPAVTATETIEMNEQNAGAADAIAEAPPPE